MEEQIIQAINESNIPSETSAVGEDIIKTVITFSGVIMKVIIELMTKIGLPVEPAVVIIAIILLFAFWGVIKFVFQVTIKAVLIILLIWLFAGFFMMPK